MKILCKLLRLFKKKTGHSDIGDLFSIEEFNQYIDWQVFIQGEGLAYYADAKYEYGQVDDIYKLKKCYTHIMWYNK